MNKSILCSLAAAGLILLGLMILIQMSDEDTPGRGDEQLILVPDGWRRLDDHTIVIDAGILPGELRAIWVEYGLEAGDLKNTTPRMAEELGMGTRGEYGSYSLTIPPDDLEPGRSYFYRLVGETEGGDIIRSGLNRFTAGK